MAKHAITSVIYDRKGRVLSIGQNSYVKSHPLMAHHGKKVGENHKIYLHAEVASIIKCPDISKAYRILVTRYGKNGLPAMAKPCAICQSAIDATNIKIIDYTIG